MHYCRSIIEGPRIVTRIIIIIIEGPRTVAQRSSLIHANLGILSNNVF